MIKWFKAFILGIIIWYVLTFVYGTFVGVLNLNELSFFNSNSNLHNFILYPFAVWLSFKITKTSFWGNSKDKEENEKMKKNDYSKRDYNKKFYWSGDKKDLRKSFPKWTMIAWALIDFTIGVGLIWYAFSWIENTWIYYLLFLGGLFSFTMCYVHLSYLWGGKIWGASKK